MTFGRLLGVAAAAIAILGVSGFTATAAAQAAAAICHQCDWLRIQISDIDEKIAGWERQIASINKYADLKDPNIQGALRDINGKIAALKAKKTVLQGQLAECEKRCAAAKAKETPPVGPPAHAAVGAATPAPTSQASVGTTPAPSGEPATTGPAGADAVPAPAPECSGMTPPASPPQGEDESNGFNLPPSPNDPDALDNWNHMLTHMALTMFGGDSEDLDDVLDDIHDSINDAIDELLEDPTNTDAKDRLDWLRARRNDFEYWAGYARVRETFCVAKYVIRALPAAEPSAQINQVFLQPGQLFHTGVLGGIGAHAPVLAQPRKEDDAPAKVYIPPFVGSKAP